MYNLELIIDNYLFFTTQRLFYINKTVSMVQK